LRGFHLPKENYYSKQFYKLFGIWRSMVEIQEPVNYDYHSNQYSLYTGLQGETPSRYIKRTVCSNISKRPVSWAQWYWTGKHRKPNSRYSTEISGLWDYRRTLFPNLGYINHVHRPPGRVDTHPIARSIVLFLIHSFVWILRVSFFIVFPQC